MSFTVPDARDVDPDKIEIAMVIRETGEVITEWIDYVFNENYLCPTSGFHFTVGGRPFQWFFERGVRPGARISLRLGNTFVADGYIDDFDIGAERATGIDAVIEGRDGFGYMVDGHSRPKSMFKEGDTLEEALKQIFAPFGFKKFALDNNANRNLQTGLVSGEKFSAGGKKGPKPLKSFKLHQTKPYPNESAIAFAQRMATSHGLWLRLSADGETVVVSKPDFDREPLHALYRTFDQGSNVLGGRVKYSVGEQPTIIIADGIGGGGEFGTSRLRAKMVNPAVITDDPEYLKIWFEYPDAKWVAMGGVGTPFVAHKCRALFLHDQSSQTQQQLENFIKREMALFLRKSLQATFSCIGHGQLINGTFCPFVVDTMVKVDDEVSGCHETLWTIGRTFSRARKGGTKTKIELLRAHTLDLGEAEPEQAAKLPTNKKPRRERAPIEEQLTSIDTARRQRGNGRTDGPVTKEEEGILTQFRRTFRR